MTDKPVLVGVGISTPAQAAQVAEIADGVIVGSAIIRRLLDSDSLDGAIEFVAQMRESLDNVSAS